MGRPRGKPGTITVVKVIAVVKAVGGEKGGERRGPFEHVCCMSVCVCVCGAVVFCVSSFLRLFASKLE